MPPDMDPLFNPGRQGLVERLLAVLNPNPNILPTIQPTIPPTIQPTFRHTIRSTIRHISRPFDIIRADLKRVERTLVDVGSVSTAVDLEVALII